MKHTLLQAELIIKHNKIRVKEDIWWKVRLLWSF